MLMKIWNYIKGYVIIRVEGFFLEKFINISVHRKFCLWDIKRTKSHQMEAKMGISDFRKIRPVAKKSRCTVRIKNRKGLPFLLHRYRYRKAFLVGAVVFLGLIGILTSFVWNIEITGNNRVTKERLFEALSANGAKVGILKVKINPQYLAADMMLDVKDLAWIGIEQKGTKLKVEVAERQQPPEIVNRSQPCDIYSKKDGIIKSVVAKSGLEVVKAGMTVKKDQLLVTGLVPNKNPAEPSRLVHAMAVVNARTWYEDWVPIETTKEERVIGSGQKNLFYLNIFNKNFKLFPGQNTFAEYEKTEDRKVLSLGKDLELPFVLIKEQYREILHKMTIVEMSEAQEIAIKKAQENVLAQIPEGANIIKTDRRFIDYVDGKTYAVITTECLEDIGEIREIGGK